MPLVGNVRNVIAFLTFLTRYTGKNVASARNIRHNVKNAVKLKTIVRARQSLNHLKQ